MYRTTFIALLIGTAIVAAPQLSQAQETAPESAQISIERFVGDEPPSFATADEALAAFKTAIAADTPEAIGKLLGLDVEMLKKSEGLAQRLAEIREDAATLISVKDADGTRIITIGTEVWPFPFPVTKLDDGTWAFATYAGLEEIVNRRVGENELQAIATAKAYVDAQRDYAALDHDGDGVLEYAQKLVSGEGLTDGLYWPADEANGESPAGAAINQAALDKANEGKGYFGYHFKILKSQGEKIAGGKYDYVINGNMIAGFALVAWPVQYAVSGVSSFVVNQAGIVYEKDLGEDTAKAIEAMETFNPDESWEIDGD
jgi:hypothetical protein